MALGYFIHRGDKTTCGGIVIEGDEGWTTNGVPRARHGDRVRCGKDGKSYPILGGVPSVTSNGIPLAGTLHSVSGCPCNARLLNSIFTETYEEDLQQPPNHGYARKQASLTQLADPGLERKTAISRSTGNRCIFSKSCISVPAGSTDAGSQSEPAHNFGDVLVLAPTGSEIAGGAMLGKVAGDAGRSLGSWAIRGATSGARVGVGATASAAGSVFGTALLALWPRDIGDGTLYTPEQLAGMTTAETRVRFQFRQFTNGDVRIYGIHTRPGSGAESVPVTLASWNASRTAMVADLGGITITWTPNDGPIATAPTSSPGIPLHLDTLLVHPIPEDRDSQITTYPGQGIEDATWQDGIIVFPADSGVPPLYLVFAKPAVRPLEVDLFSAFNGRARNGLHVDHMPSQAALRRYLSGVALVGLKEIDEMMDKAAGIAVPARIHQRYSETYGWRNTAEKQILDASDLRKAVDSNFDAIEPYLLEEGFAQGELESARAKIHRVNQEQGWY